MEIYCESISGGCNTVYAAIELDGGHLMAYPCSNAVVIYDMQKLRVLCTLGTFEKRVNSVKFFSLDGKLYVVAVSGDGIISLWMEEGWTLVATEKISEMSLQQVRALDGVLIVLGIDGIVRVLDMGLRVLQALAFGNNTMECMDMVKYRGTTMVALSGQDMGVHIYEWTQSLEFRGSLKGHIRSVNSLSFRVVGEQLYLASGGKDGYIRLWRMDGVEEGKGTKAMRVGADTCYMRLDSVLQGHNEEVSSVCWYDDTTIASSSFDCNLILWQQSGIWLVKDRLGQSSGNKNQLFGVATRPGELVAHTLDGGILYWRWGGMWEESIILTGHFAPVTDLDTSSRGYVVTCSDDQTTRLWAKWLRNDTWHEVARPQVHGYDINTVQFLQMGDNMEYVVSGAEEKIIRIFKPTPLTANFINTLSQAKVTLSDYPPCNGLYRVDTEAVSQPLGLMNKQYDVPEDEQDSIDVSTITYDRPPTHSMLSARGLWPELNKLYGHGYEVSRVATHGHLIASACRSTSEEAAAIIVWDALTYRSVGKLRAHNFTVVDMQFSRSGRYLIASSKDRRMSLFKLDEGEYKLVGITPPASRIVYACRTDESVIVSVSRDKRVRMYNMSLELVLEKKMHSAVTACDLSSSMVLLGFETGQVEVYTNTLTLVASVGRLYQHHQKVNRLRILREEGDRTTFVTCSDDHTVRVFRM